MWHDALWAILEKQQSGVDTKMMTLMRNLYADSRAVVRVGNQMSQQFQSTVGVRQGCLLSPILFNAFLEEIVARATDGFEGGVTIHGERINNLKFADDIALLANDEQELHELTRRLSESSAKLGMEISAEKK